MRQACVFIELHVCWDRSVVVVVGRGIPRMPSFSVRTQRSCAHSTFTLWWFPSAVNARAQYMLLRAEFYLPEPLLLLCKEAPEHWGLGEMKRTGTPGRFNKPGNLFLSGPWPSRSLYLPISTLQVYRDDSMGSVPVYCPGCVLEQLQLWDGGQNCSPRVRRGWGELDCPVQLTSQSMVTASLSLPTSTSHGRARQMIPLTHSSGTVFLYTYFIWFLLEARCTLFMHWAGGVEGELFP